MYRNKSSVSLRILANSLKQSITLDKQKVQNREFKPLRSSASTVNLPTYKQTRNSLVDHKNINQEYLIMLQTRKPKGSGGIASTLQKNENHRDIIFSQSRYNINETRDLMKGRSRFMQMTNRDEGIRGDRLPQSNAYDRSAAPKIPSMTKQKDPLTSMLAFLQQQHRNLSQLLHHQQDTSYGSLKSYTKFISESQILTQQLRQIQATQSQFIEHKKQLHNRLSFLLQEEMSTQMNLAEQLAEKEYCEEFLQKYQNQYQFKEEAKNVMKMIELQYKTTDKVVKEILSLESKLIDLETQFKKWKIEENVELKQRKFQNKLKDHRIQMMKIQQDLDSITQEIITKQSYNDFKKDQEEELIVTSSEQNGIRKIREYICSFFKKYNQQNLNHISHAEIADGIDLFMCKEGLINQFIQFVKAKTENISLIYGMYLLKLSQYCDCLKKIENLFYNQKTDLNRVIALNFEKQITYTKQKIKSLHTQSQVNQTQIMSLQQTIDKILAQDSLLMIELLSKKDSDEFYTSKTDGLFNLQEIKSKIKQIKLGHVKRIKRVIEVFLRLKKLQEQQSRYDEINKFRLMKFVQEKESLMTEIQLWSKKIREIQVIKQGYETKKSKYEKLIDDAISKMKQKDNIQLKLQALQKQIETIKKQKIEAIRQKHQKQLKNRQSETNSDELKAFQQTRSKIRPSSVKNLNDSFKTTQCKKIDSRKAEDKLRLEPFRNFQMQIGNQNDRNENASASFRMTKDIQAFKSESAINYEKTSNNTQSSPINIKQKLSLGALNRILLSKCNLVASKDTQNQTRQRNRQPLTFGYSITSKQNKYQSNELALESNARSLKNSKRNNKQNSSRKKSTFKDTKKNTLQTYNSNKNTATKLSLSTTTNRKKPLQKLQTQSQEHSNSKKVKSKTFQQTKIQHINTIISDKLLR